VDCDYFEKSPSVNEYLLRKLKNKIKNLSIKIRNALHKYMISIFERR